MQSIIRKKLYGSVKIFYLNRDLLIKSLKKCIEKVTEKKPEVEKIILFGSIVETKSSRKNNPIRFYCRNKIPSFF